MVATLGDAAADDVPLVAQTLFGPPQRGVELGEIRQQTLPNSRHFK